MDFQYDPEVSVAKDSPIGPGTITGVSPGGHPEVDGIAVAWLVLEDGRVFDPYGVMAEVVARRAATK